MDSELAIRRGPAPALAIAGLGYRYPQAARPSLTDVSLELSAGEFVLLAGRSASGKSTLLKAACGLVPHFHGGEVEGSIEVAGLDALASGPGELAGAVGYLAQDPETQVVSTTVAAEIALPLELRGHPAAARARAVEEVALALAIPHLLGRTVDTLSGGELQRVALAAALVGRPRLILLDEPTSQLDPVSGDELIWLLRRLNEEWGVSVLLAEHRLERCLAAADRVVSMEAGAIAFDGPPAEFLAWAQDADPALETPAARLFSLVGLEPPPVGVRAARATLESTPAFEAGIPTPSTREGEGLGIPATATATATAIPHPGKVVGAKFRPPTRADSGADAVLSARGLWVELDRGEALRDVLKGIDLRIDRGERVALMGRNGAGKSTLLRAAAGIVGPRAGSLQVDSIALLTQNPGDYLVRERVGEELPGEPGRTALRTVGLEHAVDADPRDLSGGERQRLALAIALAGRLDGNALPGLVALDEPTRGMDRGRKDELVELIDDFARRGAGVVVATHDVEFAAAFAERVVLLGEGVVVADGPAPEVLSGGWYFATEVARVLDLPGVITPEQGAAALRQITPGAFPNHRFRKAPREERP
ncbi:MAG TPA: ATP-binding cassette domain-containing protein [Solirubrobacterales bacterium]|nr:ATP-binding cassette domain-containing protein [Solirubrobacterales bacterium]